MPNRPKPDYDTLEAMHQEEVWEHGKTKNELDRIRRQRDGAYAQRDKIWNWMSGLHQATLALLYRVNDCEQCGLEANGDVAKAVIIANAALAPEAESRPLTLRSALEVCLRILETDRPEAWADTIHDVRLALGLDEYREPEGTGEETTDAV